MRPRRTTHTPHHTRHPTHQRSKDAEQLSSVLRSNGLQSSHYHADMDPADRQRAHMDWAQGRLQVRLGVCARGAVCGKALARRLGFKCTNGPQD
jgi:hypothetical protein